MCGGKCFRRLDQAAQCRGGDASALAARRSTGSRQCSRRSRKAACSGRPPRAMRKPGKPGCGRGPRSAVFSSARAAARQAAGARPAAASGCFSRASSGNRCQLLRHGVREQPEENGWRRLVERLAGAVVGHHAPTQQLGGDASGQRAVGRHQSGAGMRAFPARRAGRARWRPLPPARRRPGGAASRRCWVSERCCHVASAAAGSSGMRKRADAAQSGSAPIGHVVPGCTEQQQQASQPGLRMRGIELRQKLRRTDADRAPAGPPCRSAAAPPRATGGRWREWHRWCRRPKPARPAHAAPTPPPARGAAAPAARPGSSAPARPDTPARRR